MKKIRIIISVILILMISFGWMSQLIKRDDQKKEYNDLILQAEESISRSLYQKAAIKYKTALDLDVSEKLCQKWIETCKAAYENEEITIDDYIDEISIACQLYPKCTEFWETIIYLSIQIKDYKQAKKYYNDAINSKVKSERLTELRDSIFYSYTESSKVFNEIISSSDGYTALYDGNQWGIMNPEGDWEYESTYSYIGPMNKNSLILNISEQGTRIFNNAGVVQAIITDEIDSARICTDNIMPLHSDKTWKYYNVDKSQYILDKYDDATSFCNGVAAVKKDQKWTLIDTDGEKISEDYFDNIVALSSGEYIYDGIMIGSLNKKYGIFDENGSKKCDFEAEDMDFYLGGLIAYKDKEGMWGYVDSNGKIVIKPQYEDAKSFSNGLAAVKIDGKWGFINSDGRCVIDNKFHDACYFTQDGKCFVSISDGEFFMISLRFPGEQ